jgi:hypothetical protein
LPSFLKQSGRNACGVSRTPLSDRKRKRSAVTGWWSGAPFSFQSGISSLIARGSMIAPERMCAPGSEPFSRTTTETSCARSAASCLRRIAAARPAGPAPTITTSYSIDSRGPNWARISAGVMRVSRFVLVG